MSTLSIEKPTTINIYSLFPTLIFFRFFIDWVKRIYKKFSKSQLWVQSELLGGRPFLNELVKAEDSDMLREEYGGIRKEDVEMVMGRMGFCFEVEDDDDDDRTVEDDERVVFNSEQMSKLFEEKEASLEEVKAAFDVFDENKDGVLDSGEVQRVVCNLLGFKVGLGIQEMIRPFDLNGDGMIDFQEFVKLIENSFNC